MAKSLNKVMLIGNLGRDPEIKTFEGGAMLARLAIATSDTYVSRKTNQEVTNTEWHTVILRRRLAEVADKFLHKGDRIYVEGALRTRNWTDDKGETRYTTEINALDMVMLGGPGGGQTSGGSNATAATAKTSSSPAGQTPPPVDLAKDEDDDLPF